MGTVLSVSSSGMLERRFEALGTSWTILVDTTDQLPVSAQFWDQLDSATTEFDNEFSRFKEQNQVTRFRSAAPGTYSISEQLTHILAAADRLRHLTHGKYDPAIGTLLEAAGYDATYSFETHREQLTAWKLPQWFLNADTQQLTLDGGVVFDIGGIGKGYWIDQLSQLLHQAGYHFHLVDGGGDIFATSKSSGEAWQVAIEWPGKPNLALGKVELLHQGFAASDTFKRRWGQFHHILDPDTKEAVPAMLGCVAVGPSAWLADQLTSGLSLTSSHDHPVIASALQSEYLVLTSEHQLHVSAQWPGQLY